MHSSRLSFNVRCLESHLNRLGECGWEGGTLEDLFLSCRFIGVAQLRPRIVLFSLLTLETLDHILALENLVFGGLRFVRYGDWIPVVVESDMLVKRLGRRRFGLFGRFGFFGRCGLFGRFGFFGRFGLFGRGLCLGGSLFCRQFDSRRSSGCYVEGRLFSLAPFRLLCRRREHKIEVIGRGFAFAFAFGARKEEKRIGCVRRGLGTFEKAIGVHYTMRAKKKCISRCVALHMISLHPR